MGSSARSLREALGALPGVELDEIGEDLLVPRHHSRLLRGINRLLRPLHVAEIERELRAKLAAAKPDALVVYKGASISAEAVRQVKAAGVYTVNVFPDYSPHAYGSTLKDAIGEYNLVISTKHFHPKGWAQIYGYSNPCVCVPHGYDPTVHYWPNAPSEQEFDVVLAASWRPQYEALMKSFYSELKGRSMCVGLAGPGWVERRNAFPADWKIVGPLFGRAYGEWLRRAKIVIAPVHYDVLVNGVRQPGDEDTTRTYELAAAGCFFLHRRTPYAQTLYDEQTEVPMWDSAQELASLVETYLPFEEQRQPMAAAAHRRAVPTYSVPARAEQIFKHIHVGLARHRHDR